MQIGRKLRKLREERRLSQGDIEKRTGLVRAYTSRIENGYTIPTVETLEKFAYALEVPLYRFFTDSKKVKMPKLPEEKGSGASWGESGEERRELQQFAKAFSRLSERDLKILLMVAQGLVSQASKR